VAASSHTLPSQGATRTAASTNSKKPDSVCSHNAHGHLIFFAFGKHHRGDKTKEGVAALNVTRNLERVQACDHCRDTPVAVGAQTAFDNL
jgi:hypothetical protein